METGNRPVPGLRPHSAHRPAAMQRCRRAEAVPGYTGAVRPWTGVRVTALTLAILVGGLPDTAATPAQQARVALVGGTLYPSPTEPPIPDGVVVIVNGRISAVGQRDTMRVPDGIATLECSGSTITAGFWNSHVHFFENQWTDRTTHSIYGSGDRWGRLDAAE